MNLYCIEAHSIMLAYTPYSIKALCLKLTNNNKRLIFILTVLMQF